MPTVPFTREGVGGPACEPTVYGEVTFQVECNGCVYGPGDDPHTRLVLREGPIGAATGKWGSTRVLYR